jgi:hypothetical protein
LAPAWFRVGVIMGVTGDVRLEPNFVAIHLIV